jgi:hypothetical protein
MFPTAHSTRWRNLMIAAFVAFSARTTASALADPDASQILNRARQVVEAQTSPDTISFRTIIEVLEGNKDEFEHFQGEALSNSDIRVRGVSEEEQADAHETSGVNFKITWEIGWNTGAGGRSESGSQDAHRVEASPDYLGMPYVSPRYLFGLLPQRAKTTQSNGSPDSGLHSIATVTAVANAYRVSLVGTEPVEGFLTYHLRLEPISEPKRYRLRDLWIDIYNYQIVQLLTQGNFVQEPLAVVPWLITFQNIAGVTYIKDEKSLEPVVYPHDRVFAVAKVEFQDIEPADPSELVLPAMDMNSNSSLREP